MFQDIINTQQIDISEENLARLASDELPILPLRNITPMPMSVLPLAVGIPRSIQLIEEASNGSRIIGLAAMKDPEIEQPGPDEIYETGIIALIHKVVRAEDGSLQVIAQGLERMKISEWTATEPYLKARVELAPETIEEGVEAEALRESLLDIASEVAEMLPNLPEGIGAFLRQIKDNRQLVYLIAANTPLEVHEAQQLLEADSVNEKMRLLVRFLIHQKEVLSLRKQITEEASEEMSKAQRDYYLRQQLEAIRRELGESDETEAEVEEYRRRIAEAELPEEAEKEALRELKRMEKMPPQAAEYSVIKTYLDWLLDLPWHTLTEDNLDIEHARQVLDEDHYDLQKVKDRILEFLAVR
jgi:ATP-dependent Lon protease